MSKSKPVVAIIMGSNSDWPIMENSAKILDDFDIPYESKVISAHRTPDLMFEFAENATRPKILDWVNVELTAAQSLSVATVSRMISACRGYWDYLERHKGLTLEPPFNKVLPSKPKRKTKAAMEAEIRAFRVVDCQKLMASCQHPTLTDLIQLGAYTGCRIE